MTGGGTASIPAAIGANDPVTLYGVGVRGVTNLPGVGVWSSGGSSAFHIQESSSNIGQFVAGSQTFNQYARVNNVVSRGVFVGSATWEPGVRFVAYVGGASTAFAATDIPSGSRYMQGNTAWSRLYLYKGLHTASQRWRIERMLAREFEGLPDGIAGPAESVRTSIGTSSVSGQTGILLDPITAYIAYVADGTRSGNFPTVMQITDGSNRIAVQGRNTGGQGIGIRVDTTDTANQTGATTATGRDAGMNVFALRLNQGSTLCEYWANGIYGSKVVLPGIGVGRTSFTTGASSSDMIMRRAMFFNQAHTDLQINQITSWLWANVVA
jgi:hypothetical protein